MTRILVLYGTTDGQTAKIAGALGNALRMQGSDVDVVQQRPTAFLSVCLAVLQQEPEVQQELSTIIDRFLRGTGWRPTLTKPVAGALLYRRYGPLKRWVMKRIVQKAGGDTDTSRDYEYTDWEDLRAVADEFGSLVQDGASIRGVKPAANPRVA